jgi:hypothetical protein
MRRADALLELSRRLERLPTIEDIRPIALALLDARFEFDCVRSLMLQLRETVGDRDRISGASSQCLIVITDFRNKARASL